MNFEECKSYIDKVLLEGDGEPFDICDYLYQGLIQLNAQEQPAAFQYICELFGTVESSESFGIVISKHRNKEDMLRNQYGNLVKSLIELYIKQNVEESIFYTNLWNNIVSSGLFPHDEEKIFALYYILTDNRIPYFCLDSASLYSLSNERYKQIRNDNVKAIQKIRFILKASFSQKTERASALLAELGIGVPQNVSDGESINIYEKQLVQMIEIFTNGNDSELMQALIRRLSK